MDPDECWRMIALQLAAHPQIDEERFADHVDDLTIWLDMGGFPPRGLSSEAATLLVCTLRETGWYKRGAERRRANDEKRGEALDL